MRNGHATGWRAAALFSIALALGAAVQAAEVKMLFGQSLAPFANEGDGSGIEIDIIRAALAVSGHTLTLSFVPQARVPVTWKAQAFDAAATVTPDSGMDAAYSTVH